MSLDIFFSNCSKYSMFLLKFQGKRCAITQDWSQKMVYSGCIHWSSSNFNFSALLFMCPNNELITELSLKEKYDFCVQFERDHPLDIFFTQQNNSEFDSFTWYKWKNMNRQLLVNIRKVKCCYFEMHFFWIIVTNVSGTEIEVLKVLWLLVAKPWVLTFVVIEVNVTSCWLLVESNVPSNLNWRKCWLWHVIFICLVSIWVWYQSVLQRSD